MNGRLTIVAILIIIGVFAGVATCAIQFDKPVYAQAHQIPESKHLYEDYAYVGYLPYTSYQGIGVPKGQYGYELFLYPAGVMFVFSMFIYIFTGIKNENIHRYIRPRAN